MLVAKMWKSRRSGSRIICQWNGSFAWKWPRIHSSDYISVAVTTTPYVTDRRGVLVCVCVCVCVYCVPLPHQSGWSSGLSLTPGSSFQILSGWKKQQTFGETWVKNGERDVATCPHTFHFMFKCVGRERCQRVCVCVCVCFQPHRL